MNKNKKKLTNKLKKKVPKEEPEENTISPNEKEDGGEEEKPTLGDK